MMKLYSGTTCPYSHRCRIVLFEKGMDFEIIDVDVSHKPDDLIELSPHGRLPVLVERDLRLDISNIINEYIDERFPHPQMMPADPMLRARARLFLYDFETQFFAYIEDIEKNTPSADNARKVIRDGLTMLAPIFSKQPFMLGEEFSMVDVAVAPLLWRLNHYGIELPKQADPLLVYSERLFSRPAYIEAMTPSEKAMRK